MKNGGLLNRIFNVDRGNEENEDDRYFLERSFLLDRPGGGELHFFLFSFHGKSLTIFEEREREREIISESFRGWHSSSNGRSWDGFSPLRRSRIRRSLKLRK